MTQHQDGHFNGEQPLNPATFRQVAELPRWRVTLHDDEVHDPSYVVEAVVNATPLSHSAAVQRVIDAQRDGSTMLLLTHQELAEHYYVLLSKQNLVVSIERE